MSVGDQGLEDITHAVLKELSASCAECGITDDIINKQSFACSPESPTYVTYRARLEGTSETDSGSLISLIEEWVSGGASIIVTGVLMTVDTKFSVAISSLSEGECSPTQPPTKNPFSTTYATIIGGVLIIIAITLLFVVVIFIVRRCCCGNVSNNRKRE